MMTRKYKHIFFDLDNTLWDFRKNAYAALKLATEHFHITDIEFDIFFEVYSKHNKLLWEQYRNKTISKNELVTKRFRDTFAELQIEEIDAGALNKCYLELMTEQKLLKEGTLDILQFLKGKNYHLYIITNGFKEVQHKKLINSGISDFFERLYISEELKMPKPAAEVFEYAVKSSNAKKKESIMIGDDWEVDVMGALNFGMDAVYFCNTGANRKSVDSKKNNLYTIKNLTELRQILY